MEDEIARFVSSLSPQQMWWTGIAVISAVTVIVYKISDLLERMFK